MQHSDNSSIKKLFLLDTNVTYLNFGSFGACPKPIFEDYQNWQIQLEKEPVQFLTVKGIKFLKNSREALAAFIHCDADDLVFTPNPTHAINLIAKNLNLQAGDEILTTDLEYGAMDRTWEYYCNSKGAVYNRYNIELPLKNTADLVDGFIKKISKKTKAIFISHITSSTALILPVNEICEQAKKRGVLTIVDGAHVPGHIPLDLSKLQADIFTGACHKWMMAPKGCSFLYVKKEFQSGLDPLIISWGYKNARPSSSLYLDYHQLNGTRDFSAYLTIPKCIEFFERYEWVKHAERCRNLVKDNAQRFTELLKSKALAPLTDEFIGQMLSLPINTTEPETLQRDLYEAYKIEIPVMQHGDHTYLRFSIQAFNDQTDLDKLYNALKEIIANTELI
jgi:isopenicillin-N epimerase